MSPFTLLDVGPVNGGLLLLSCLVGLVWAWRAGAQLRHGEDVSLRPLVTMMAIPLFLSVFAQTTQLSWAMEDAAAHDIPAARQTLMAAAISRAVSTQVLAGFATACTALVLLVGALSAVSLSERPRSRLAAAAAGLTFLLTATTLASGGASGVWGLAAWRALLYLFAGGATTAALLATHKRGPGAHLGPVVAATLPLLVAGVDAAAGGWVTGDAFVRAAMAAPADKQHTLWQGYEAVGVLQGFSGMSVLLAVGLASLGPLASASRHRDLVAPQLGAIAISVVAAVAVIVVTAAPLQPFFVAP
jgi:hypothetical protein